MNVLWHAARGTIDHQKNEDEIMREIGALQKEMKLRSLISRP